MAIICPTYKREEVLENTIKSVVNNIHNISYDFFILFQNYSDTFIKEITNKYNIISFVSKDGIGYGNAMLYLFKEILNYKYRYKYIIYIDDDCVVVKDGCDKLFNKIETSKSNVGAATCRLGWNAQNNREYFYTVATFYIIKYQLIKNMFDGNKLIKDLEMRMENNISIELLLNGYLILIDKECIVKHRPCSDSKIGDKTIYKQKMHNAALILKDKYKFCRVTKNGSLIYSTYFKNGKTN